jgi:hypothetical protein
MQGKSFGEILKIIGSTLKEKVGKTLLKVIPSAFGLKKRAANLLGISIDDTGGADDLTAGETAALKQEASKPNASRKMDDKNLPYSNESNTAVSANINSDDRMKQQLKIAQAHSKLIVNQTNISGELLNTQIELLKENISLLREIADKTGVGANIITNNTTSVTNMNNQRNLRELQEVYSH